MTNIERKTAFVTGAGKGIGAAIVKSLAKAGNNNPMLGCNVLWNAFVIKLNLNINGLLVVHLVFVNQCLNFSY